MNWKPIAISGRVFGAKGDALIFAGILLAALLMIGYQIMPVSGADPYVVEITGPEGRREILADGYAGGAEWYEDVPGAMGGLRLTYAPDKGFRVESSSCPDGICVRSGYISKAGQSIVCVPNEIIIRLLRGGREEEDGLDGILR